MSESFGIEKKEQSIGYPDWGFIKCFRPGAVFQCYVLSAEDLQFPSYIRLGKFMAKTKLHITMAQDTQQRIEPASEQKGQRDGPLLTWDDLAKTARPMIFDIIVNALPGQLIANAIFDGIPGPYLQATFADNDTPIQLPLYMGYYGEHVCASW
jgi:CRISPR-associated protein Csc1